MAGRETKLTEHVHAKVVEALKGGANLKDSAAYASVSKQLVDVWITRGRDYDDHLAAGGDIIDGEDRYRMFAIDCGQATSSVRVSATATLRKAWQRGDWRAALAYLERTDPANWGKTNRVEMTGADGGAIRVADVTETERRLASSLKLAVEQHAIPEGVRQIEPAAATEVEDLYLGPTDAEIVEEHASDNERAD